MKKMKNIEKILVAISILLMLTTIVSGSATYNTYVDNDFGFYRIQLVSGSSNSGSTGIGSITDFTISVGDSIQWVNDATPEESITIVSKDGLWKSELANIKWNNYLFSYTFNNPGTFEVYIKEYPNLKHQRITVVGYEEDVGTCEYPGNPPCSPLPVVTTPVPTPVPTQVVMGEIARNELNRLTQLGKQYKLISIKDFAFVPDTVYADQSVVVFLFNEDSKVHYVNFGDGYTDIRPGNILGFCCGTKIVGTVIEYQDRDYPSMKGRVTVTGTTPPVIGSLKSYDNIKVWHSIELCNVASDAEREITEGPLEKNCGNPDLNIDNYPLDLMPSGGGSGKVSASEMVMVKIKTGGHIELIPWRTQPVKISWYNETGRLMFSTVNQVNSINYETMSFIGHFSHEINEPGKYFVDIDEYDLGSARVVFDVTSSGQTVIVSPIATAVPIVTYTSVPIVTVNPPALGSDSDSGGGCWDSYVGFGTCAGGAIAETGVGILLGIGQTIADIFGL